MCNLMNRLDDLKALIQEPDFLEGKGLSNEENIRFFCYEPKDEMAVRHFTEKLMTDKNLKCHLIEFNLYKVFLSICEDKRIIDQISVQEVKKGSQFVLNQLRQMANNTAFIKKMKYEPHKYGDVILITAVGEVFPFMRVHSLLDALQPYFSDVPVLVMYPGIFDGYHLRLFEKLSPSSYYRGFRAL